MRSGFLWAGFGRLPRRVEPDGGNGGDNGGGDGDPLNLPDLIFALDPARSAIAINGGVSQISDLGAGGKHFAQDDPNSRLTLEATGIQDGPALRGQSDGYLRREEALCWPQGDFAIYFLARGPAQGNNRLYSEGNASTDLPHWYLDSDAIGRLRVRAHDNAGTRFVDAITTARCSTTSRASSA
jgi:hypothetical protein